MPQKNKATDGYKQLSESITSGHVEGLYIFYGEERYLLERCLIELRKHLCPDGLDGFNYRRFEGRSLTAETLDDAINTLPVLAEKTLLEVHDFDIFKHEQKEILNELFKDLPDYVCLVFIYDTVQYKPDGRIRLNVEIQKNAQVVEFTVQSPDKLVNWITRHFADAGKKISKTDAQYLSFITGGLMSSLHGEIGKTAAFAVGDTVSRDDIDAVVTPVLDAVAYKLTDALARRDHQDAMRILDELLRMREAPHKLMFSISLKMRQLLAARVCLDSSSGKEALMDICGLREDYKAKALLDTARRLNIAECRDAVLFCAETALDLNSTSEPEVRMTELITRLAHRKDQTDTGI